MGINLGMSFARRSFGFASLFSKSVSSVTKYLPSTNVSLYDTIVKRNGCTLEQLHRTGPVKKYRPSKNPLGFNVPMLKGVVLRTLVKKPKKPNSANRKCVLVRLSNGKEMTAYIPGEGHNLQEHNTVLVRPGRTKDVPGLKLKCIRGKHDLSHVVKTKI